MLTVDWQHIILASIGYSGTSRRIARMRAAGARFAGPYREGSWSGETWSPNHPESGQAPLVYSPPLSPPPDPYGGRTYVFEFWSVNGSSSTGIPFRAVPGGLSPSLSIGGGPWMLNAKAWYVWDRNSGEGPTGPGERDVEIDAFNWTSNDFIPDYFVDIAPDGPSDPSHGDLGPLTYTANEDGYISTEGLKEPITIKARGQFGDGYYRYQFSHWQVIRSSGSPLPEVNDSTITVHLQNTLKAYAIYDQVAEDPGEVEDVLRPFVIVTNPDGTPLVIADPLGGIRPIPPRGPDDLKQIVEMLHKIENDLHKRYKF
jgi:hypothetical protein